LENSVVAATSGVQLAVSGIDVVVQNNTIVGGRNAVQLSGVDSSLNLLNNILVANRAHHPDAQVIRREGGTLRSDYNLLLGRNGAWIGNAEDGLWEKVIYWQQKSNQDTNSFSAEPLFADESAGDFHLRSTSGRFLAGSNVIDLVDSPAIDSGAPFSAFGNEPAPNGGRINLGAFGNTPEASRSRTAPWLLAMTINDGGVLRGTNTLRWLGGGMNPTNRVRLEYSANAGGAWTAIASDLPATSGFYEWDTSLAPSSLDALWRVVLEANSNIWDQTDNIFNIRNDTRSFYVNNASTSGDVFTTAPGNPANDGRTPASPKATLENLLATYDTEPFDTVYIDTGIYTSSVIQVIWSRGGDSNANMVIRGSTNIAAGGTVIRRPTRSGDAMVLNASYVTVRDLTLENAGRGLFISTNRWNVADQVEIRSNRAGIVIDQGANHRIVSSRIHGNEEGGLDVFGTQGLAVENITFVNNAPFSLRLTNTANVVAQNNIFYHDVVTSNSQAALAGGTVAVYNAFVDYNVYHFGPGAQSNTFIYGNYTNLLTWQRERFKDFRSAITNPLFVSVASNNFFLRSQAGRYNPATRTFVNDTNTSWAIDKGNPLSVFTNEPAVNGGRINIGAYGNTRYASKGTTNRIAFIRTGNEFLLITENENPYPLIWYFLNVPFNFNVSVQYSGDGGNEWTTLRSGVPAYQEYILWTNSPAYNSFDARWRIVGEGVGNTNYWDINNGQIRTFFGKFFVASIKPESGGLNTIMWRGAWNEDYQVQYATNFVVTNKLHTWQNIGPVTNLTVGGDTFFTDLQATQNPFRVYRVIWFGTNGIPYQ
jgi:hypothetical protein